MKKEEVFEQLVILWHRARSELKLKWFLSWVETVYYRSASGTVDDVRLELMAKSIDIMSDGKKQNWWEDLCRKTIEERNKHDS